MNIWTILCLIIIAWYIFFIPTICLDIAKWKGYPTTRWYFYGLLMGPIALLALIGLPDLYQRKIQKSKLEMMDKILMAIQDLTVSKN